MNRLQKKIKKKKKKKRKKKKKGNSASAQKTAWRKCILKDASADNWITGYQCPENEQRSYVKQTNYNN